MIRPYLDWVDLVVLMTVEPGFAGQKFMVESLPRLEELSKLREETGKEFLISIDGGINYPMFSLRSGAVQTCLSPVSTRCTVNRTASRQHVSALSRKCGKVWWSDPMKKDVALITGASRGIGLRQHGSWQKTDTGWGSSVQARRNATPMRWPR